MTGRPGEYDDYEYARRNPWVAVSVVVGVGLLILIGSAVRSRSQRARAEQPAREPAAALARPAAVPQAQEKRGAKERPAQARRPASERRGVEPPQVSPDLLAEVRSLETAGNLGLAREKALKLLDATADAPARNAVEEFLGRITMRLILSPAPAPEKGEYVVRPGDSVAKIAKITGSTVQLVSRSNNLGPANLIKKGDRLRVVNGKFAVEVSKSRKDLVLSLNGRFCKRYRVGTGKQGKTPVGTFVVSDRIHQPVWWRADGKSVPYGDPENILGTHWLAIQPTGKTPEVKGYGIHGTWDNASIGKAESAGCIRMRNEDVEELFTLLPIGTPVAITE